MYEQELKEIRSIFANMRSLGDVDSKEKYEQFGIYELQFNEVFNRINVNDIVKYESVFRQYDAILTELESLQAPVRDWFESHMMDMLMQENGYTVEKKSKHMNTSQLDDIFYKGFLEGRLK